jgi:regulator of sirC expression with transglutaminase-like and TPR domain
MTTVKRLDTTRESEEMLKCIGDGPDSGFDVFAGALALAALERPHIDLETYREHMSKVIDDVIGHAKGTRGTLDECIAALHQAIVVDNGYPGDIETFDDLQNANLMRVIDRSRGLPISLGILYLYAARAQGWTAYGLSFSGHFSIQIGCDGQRAIIDPLNDGAAHAPDELRRLLRATIGNDVELAPQHYAAVTDRDVLLRLQSNVKLRLAQLGEGALVVGVIKVMLHFAPTESSLWHEMAALEAKLGNLQAAIAALDQYFKREVMAGPRQEAALLLQRLQRWIY